MSLFQYTTSKSTTTLVPITFLKEMSKTKIEPPKAFVAGISSVGAKNLKESSCRMHLKLSLL